MMFIHRPEKMGMQQENMFPGYTELIIAKHRNGEVKDVHMRFLASEVKFVDENDGAGYDMIDESGAQFVHVSSAMRTSDEFEVYE